MSLVDRLKAFEFPPGVKVLFDHQTYGFDSEENVQVQLEIVQSKSALEFYSITIMSFSPGHNTRATKCPEKDVIAICDLVSSMVRTREFVCKNGNAFAANFSSIFNTIVTPSRHESVLALTNSVSGVIATKNQEVERGKEQLAKSRDREHAAKARYDSRLVTIDALTAEVDALTSQLRDLRKFMGDKMNELFLTPEEAAARRSALHSPSRPSPRPNSPPPLQRPASYPVQSSPTASGDASPPTAPDYLPAPVFPGEQEGSPARAAAAPAQPSSAVVVRASTPPSPEPHRESAPTADPEKDLNDRIDSLGRLVYSLPNFAKPLVGKSTVGPGRLPFHGSLSLENLSQFLSEYYAAICPRQSINNPERTKPSMYSSMVRWRAYSLIQWCMNYIFTTRVVEAERMKTQYFDYLCESLFRRLMDNVNRKVLVPLGQLFPNLVDNPVVKALGEFHSDSLTLTPRAEETWQFPTLSGIAANFIRQPNGEESNFCKEIKAAGISPQAVDNLTRTFLGLDKLRRVEPHLDAVLSPEEPLLANFELIDSDPRPRKEHEKFVATVLQLSSAFTADLAQYPIINRAPSLRALRVTTVEALQEILIAPSNVSPNGCLNYLLNVCFLLKTKAWEVTNV
jgi:hypothetical protein